MLLFPFVPFVVKSFSDTDIQLATESTRRTKNLQGRLVFLSAPRRLCARNKISHTEHTEVTEGRAIQGSGKKQFEDRCPFLPSCSSCLRGEIFSDPCIQLATGSTNSTKIRRGGRRFSRVFYFPATEMAGAAAAGRLAVFSEGSSSTRA